MTYRYDIFLSYRNAAPVGPWTRDHLRPLLAAYVGEELGRDVAIFVDREMPAGASWRDRMGDALHRSRIMIGVWSKRYFHDSEWCPAEFASMTRRDAMAGRGRGTPTPSLIYPIVVNDGDAFPDEASELMYADCKMHDYLSNAAHFPNSSLFMELEQHIKRLSPEIAERIASAPDWRDWPLVGPVARSPAPIGLPRITGGPGKGAR